MVVTYYIKLFPTGTDRHNSFLFLVAETKKNKETTDPNLNDLEINDNSSKDNIIIITRIDCNNGILENNNEFNIPLEILVNDNKETLTKNNCE